MKMYAHELIMKKENMFGNVNKKGHERKRNFQNYGSKMSPNFGEIATLCTQKNIFYIHSLLHVYIIFLFSFSFLRKYMRMKWVTSSDDMLFRV